MRPRKVVLVLDDNEIRRRCRRFVFETRGHYTVRSGPRIPDNPGSALTRILCTAEVAVVGGAKAEQLAAETRALLPDIKILLIPAERLTTDSPATAEAVLPATVPMIDLLDTLQTLVMRRRGPKFRRRRLSDYDEFLEGFIAQRTGMKQHATARSSEAVQ